MDTDTDTAPLPPPPTPFPDGRRALRRSTVDRHLGGVAGGVAEYLGIDPILVRIGFVVVTVFSLGLALSAYAAAWLLLPDDTDAEAPGVRWFREHGSDTGAIITLVVLVSIAAIAVSGVAHLVSTGDTDAVPVLVGLGTIGYLVSTRRPHRGTRPAAPVTAADAPTSQPPADRTRVLPVVDPEVAARQAKRRMVRNATWLAALGVGGAGSTLWATGAWNVRGWVVPVAVLAILVTGLALAPVTGWSWSLALGVVVVLPILVLSLIPGVRLRHGIGSRVARPASAEELAPSYRLGIGHQEVDLRSIDLAPGTTTRIHVAIGIGKAEVRVPANATVRLTGHLSGGAVLVDGADADLEGSDVSLDRTLPPLDPTGEADSRHPVVDLVLDVGLGAADIRREP